MNPEDTVPTKRIERKTEQQPKNVHMEWLKKQREHSQRLGLVLFVGEITNASASLFWKTVGALNEPISMQSIVNFVAQRNVTPSEIMNYLPQAVSIPDAIAQPFGIAALLFGVGAMVSISNSLNTNEKIKRIENGQ